MKSVLTCLISSFLYKYSFYALPIAARQAVQSIEQIQFVVIIIHHREPAVSPSLPNTHTTNVPPRDDVA